MNFSYTITKNVEITEENVTAVMRDFNDYSEFWNYLLGWNFNKSGLRESKYLVEILHLIGNDRKVEQIRAVRAYYMA